MPRNQNKKIENKEEGLPLQQTAHFSELSLCMGISLLVLNLECTQIKQTWILSDVNGKIDSRPLAWARRKKTSVKVLRRRRPGRTETRSYQLPSKQDIYNNQIINNNQDSHQKRRPSVENWRRKLRTISAEIVSSFYKLRSSTRRYFIYKSRRQELVRF